MRLKYYLRGAALGIIITTLIFTIAMAFTGAKNGISDDEVISRAKELGMVMADEATNSEDADTTDNSKEEAVASNDEEEKENLEKINEDASDDTEDTSVKNASDESVEYVPFSIAGGASSNTVADDLYKAGLVDDADKFNEYMNKVGVDKLIQAGSFYIASNATYDDICALLVTKQKDRDTSLPGTPGTP